MVITINGSTFSLWVELIEPEIKAQQAIDDNALLVVKVTDAENGNHAIEKRIDHLYDVMQAEIDAKAVVDQQQEEISALDMPRIRITAINWVDD